MAVLTNIPNNTSTRDWRDTVNALIKRIAALEAAGVPVTTPAPAFTTQPSVSPTSGTAGSTLYAATPGTVSNGSVVSRVWLLNGTAISSGITALPASSGTLAYQETASGPGGTTTSTVQVAAVTAATVTPTPAPSFISQPSISPNTGTAGATTFTATAGNVSNGSITARSWTINGTVISTGIAASPASSGTLTYQETATGPGGTTQSTVQQVTVATAAAAAPAFTSQPTISPSTGTAGTTTYTATPGAVSNGTITSRAWALNGSTISTGLTAAPASAGTLTYQEFATGAGGSASSLVLTRTVSAATPSLALSPTVPSVSSTAAAGTLVTNITNVPAGVTPTVTPNDGRLVIAGDASAGWKVVVGMSALSAGQVNFTVAASGATSANGVLTVTAPAGGTSPSYTVFATPAAPTMPTTFTDIAASGDTTGATDLAAVNSAFAAGQNVRLTSAGGLYYANGSIVQPGNTSLFLPATGEWRLVAGSNTNIWRNANRASLTRTDKNIVVYSPGTRTFYFNGQGSQQVRQSNQRSNQCFVPISAENVTIRGIAISGNASAIHALGCLGVDIGDIDFRFDLSTPNEDGIDLGSGTSNVRIWGLRGLVGDDVMSFYAKAGQSQTGMMSGTVWENGADVTGVLVKDVRVGCGLANMFRLQAGNGWKMQTIHGWGIHNTLIGASDGPKILLQFGEVSYLRDEGSYPADNDMSDIYMEDVSGFSYHIKGDSRASFVTVKNIVQNVKLFSLMQSANTDNEGKVTFLHDWTVDGLTTTDTTSVHSTLIGNFRDTTNPYNFALRNIALPNLNAFINTTDGVVGLEATNITVTTALTSAPRSTSPSRGVLTNVTANGANIPLGTTQLHYAGATEATAPTVTTAMTGTVGENVPYRIELKASKVVTWVAGSGDDTTQYTLTGSARDGWFLNLPAKNYEAPTDTATSGSNTYIWRGVATDEYGNTATFAHTVSITDDPNEVANEDQAYTAYKATRGTSLTPSRAQAYNTMLAGMRADGTLSLLDRLYIFADESNATDALINLVKPAGTKAALTNAPPLVLDRGFQLDGTNKAISFGSAWGAEGKVAQDSMTTGVVCNAASSATGSQYHIGSATNNTIQLFVNAAGADAFRANSSGNSTGGTSATRVGHRTITRTGATLAKEYLAGSVVATDTTTASVAVSAGFGTFGRTVTTYSSDRFAAGYTGAGMTDAQVASVHSRLNTLLASFGAGV